MAKRQAALPALFAMFYPAMLETANKLGYALALHGSMARDLDVVAIPWTDEAVPPAKLVKALSERLDTYCAGVAGTDPTKKPHGRLAWSLYLVDSGAYIDLSVMPRHRAQKSTR